MRPEQARASVVPKQSANPALHQTLVKWVLFVLTGGASVGVLLDAISNAFTFVSPQMTYSATAVVGVGWLLLEVTARLFGVTWWNAGQRYRIRRLGPQLRFGLLGVLVLLWLPRLGDLPGALNPIPPVTVRLVNRTTGDVAVARRGEFVLWFPTALYDGIPRLGGRFEVASETEESLSAIRLEASGEEWVSVRLLGNERFVRYLEGGEADLSICVGTNFGSKCSNNIPFKRRALETYYLEVELD